ncbi:adenylyl-sulfate kinase [Pseudomonas sp. SWRI111]|uniref:adenylyl-sulfate kinase n=1 Tax=Pseudomonas sp. SWRI111 TaxID=2745507 RepID=UPI00164564A1|nr:adenylyl-sulfate kinase [Pseudomonas sp. SWRI111]MBC3207678.1 adenylyl-sulfate kinase [Pseudomonas sp. SWRI111]
MSKDLVFHTTAISASMRAQVKGQRPAVIWLTGLSGAGKSTIANALEQALVGKGRHTFLLDGDNLRMGLCKDLGFADADRVENIRRVAEVSKLLVDAGLIVITAFISPFHRDRAMARDVIGTEEFIEVFVDTSLAECERRDPKGLYSKARAGQIKNFTGIDSAYEKPVAPDITINTIDEPLAISIERVLDYLDKRSGQ